MVSSTESTRDASALYDALVPLLQLVHRARTLSAVKLGVLRKLAAVGEATAATLSQGLNVSQQGISLAAKELEALGYIERRPDDSDRRKVWFAMTAAGAERLADETTRGRAALMQAIESSLTSEDRGALRAAVPALMRLSAGVTE